MKNIFENIAITLVILLALLIAALIVQYNLIEEDAFEDSIITTKEVSKSEKTTSYLDSLEGYGEDKDVKVDPTQENSANRVTVKAEDSDDSMGKALEDSYVKNLEDFTEDTKKIEEAPQVLEDVAEPDAPEQAERADEIGTALDDLLGDL
jgi:hypothetical protein